MPEILALLERGGLLIYRLLLLSVLILVVMFVGKGSAALQEAGTLPLDPLNFLGLPALGLYPNVQGLVVQALTMLIICGVFAYSRYTSRGAR
jgi:high-affinity iron transporter